MNAALSGPRTLTLASPPGLPAGAVWLPINHGSEENSMSKKENTIQIGEAYKYAEKREQEEAITAYRKKGSKLPEESIINLEKLRKERVTNKQKNIKEKTVHSFTLDLDFEILLLKHFENTGAWTISKLDAFVKRVFYRGLYDLAMKEGDEEYGDFVQLVSIGTLTETWIKEHGEQSRKQVKKDNSNIIQFPSLFNAVKQHGA